MLRCELLRYVKLSNKHNLPLKGFRTVTGTGTIQCRKMLCWHNVINCCLKLELHMQH